MTMPTIEIDGDYTVTTYPNGVVVRELTPAPASIDPLPDPAAWLIDIGPFFDRFGVAKIPTLASADATVQAIVKDCQARKWIDLQRVDVAQGLDTLIAKALIDEPLKSAILSTPVAPEENLALRRSYFP